MFLAGAGKDASDLEVWMREPDRLIGAAVLALPGGFKTRQVCHDID